MGSIYTSLRPLSLNPLLNIEGLERGKEQKEMPIVKDNSKKIAIIPV